MEPRTSVRGFIYTETPYGYGGICGCVAAGPRGS